MKRNNEDLNEKMIMAIKNKVKRICTARIPNHSKARKALRQLKTNPEVCEECNIEPCTLALYIWSKADESR